MDVVIATSAAPKDVESFFNQLKSIAQEEKFNCQLTAGVYTTGSGCYNLGLSVEGENAEKFVNLVTMALMPARWASVEGDSMLKAGMFYSTFAPKV